MKIALVHDQLQEFGGAERVLIALHDIFPEAPVYTAFINKETAKRNIKDLNQWDIRTSWASRIPFIGKLYSPLRFLAPSIWESFDFSHYDVVISSSGWYMCKGIKTPRSTNHISYIHHPPKYLYGYETAVEWQRYPVVKLYATIVNYFLKKWDVSSSKRPDILIANSHETQRRIKRFYHRDSVVIYPPVEIPNKVSSTKLQDSSYYITVSRLGRAKHIDLLIQAANVKKFKLKVVGRGRDLNYLQSLAGESVEFITDASDQERDALLKNAKAFLFASVDEEFGIAPVEAMGFGTPVIAYNSGGLKETIKQGLNGFLFEELSQESLSIAIDKLEKMSEEKYLRMRLAARTVSEGYSFERFKREILSLLPEGAI